MIPRVAWWRAFRALFDEPWTTFLGIIQLDARNLALIRPKNSADRCKRAPRRSQSLFLFRSIFLSSSLSNSFIFQLRSTSNYCFAGQKGHPQKEFHRILITNRIVRDTDSLINPSWIFQRQRLEMAGIVPNGLVQSSLFSWVVKERKIGRDRSKDLEIWKLRFTEVHWCGVIRGIIVRMRIRCGKFGIFFF